MKRFLKKAMLLCLVAALAMPTVLASDALGSDLKGRTVELGEGVSVSDNSLWSATYSDLRTEHYITYQPNDTVLPLVFYGDTVDSRNTLAAAAARLAEEGYRVVGAINGGFFNTDGTTVGLLMTDGVIRSMDLHNYYMVGIRADGTAFVDSSVVTKSLLWEREETGESGELTITAINASRANGGLYLYNEDFGASMGNTIGGVDVVLTPERSRTGLEMNGSKTFTVTQVRDSTGEGMKPDNTIPEGCYVLSANKNCSQELLDGLRAMAEGNRVTVTLSGGSEDWAEAEYALSGLYSLVEEGTAVSGLPTGAAPRTALGIKEDGTLVFYTIDGRQSGYSVGASYTQVAQRLVELGCVTAVALDGGGSTAMGVTLPGSEELTVYNSPSGGTERAVSNCILLVTEDKHSSRLTGFYVDTPFDVVLTGASAPVTAYPVNKYFGAANQPDEVDWDSTGGTVETEGDGTGIFTAGDKTGKYLITASQGSKEGTAPVRVVDTLSRLTVYREDVGHQVDTLLVEYGETVELTAVGSWYNLPVAMADSDVTWATDGLIGQVDETGLFTAGAENCEGTLTATAGGRTVTIAVKVDRGDPFTDIADHWSQSYVTRLYKLGVTTGTQLEDGSYIYGPDDSLTRGQLLVFITRMLDVDTDLYADTVMPFADADTIPDWMLPAVKAMYTLQVFSGSENGGQLWANVGDRVTREAAMTMLGRVLEENRSCDLTLFTDGAQVSQWASPYVQALVAAGVVGGNNGYLNPQSPVTRGEMAKMLILVGELPHAELIPRAVEEPIPDDDSGAEG